MIYGQSGRMLQSVVGGSLITDYVINGQGQLVIKSLAGTTTIYHYDLQGRLIAETDALGATLKEYVWLGWDLVAVIDPSGVAYAHSSYRHEPVALTNAAGVIMVSVRDRLGETSVDEDPDGDLILVKRGRG